MLNLTNVFPRFSDYDSDVVKLFTHSGSFLCWNISIQSNIDFLWLFQIPDFRRTTTTHEAALQIQVIFTHQDFY